MAVNLWNNSEASEFTNDLGLRVYTSRLLGKDKNLVLHGGGNTSVKIIEKNILGREEEILYVKGSGYDLETIDVVGFSPVRIDHLRSLSELESLSDSAMVNELVTHLTRSSAPVPSVEAILHAVIPYKFVDHTHADAVVAITNSVNGEEIIRRIYGDRVIVIPYIMPGFDLSKLCASYLKTDLTPKTTGIILLNHGIFSFGNTAEESYNRMIELVGMAEDYLEKNTSHDTATQPPQNAGNLLDLAELRNKVSKAAGYPVIMKRYTDAKTMGFCNHKELATISQQGPATPDHVIRTKRLPLAGRDVDAYTAAYKEYFAANEPLAKERKKMLDPAPRVILDAELGMCTIGKTAKDAQVVADIYHHTIDIILWASRLDGYKALSAKDIFDVEYWELEQAKLNKAGSSPIFTGEVALVTGAASGIGKACVESLLKRGASVVGLDINPLITTIFKQPNFLGIECNVTSSDQLHNALNKAVNEFGGLDMLVLNAGIFPPGRPISELATEDWQKVMNVNLDANFILLREAYPLLKLAPKGGRVVIIGSKNVPAPGPGAAAYSASKAALNQLARVAALEWGKDGIRINSVHPNAVFDTGLWSEDILRSRAASYGLTVDEYKKNNILKTEVTSRDVSELAVELCGPLFNKTTGAQVAVDGGNDRVI
jgi:rhamnose utilization protein RhaD (predicted bifunctional aldolase and dehydrogenase)/NAD(P)-dependent dehydrogenase (short-subunit alcohol dehydrogenase family)